MAGSGNTFFYIHYMPFKAQKNAGRNMLADHMKRREFFDSTGVKNIYDYIAEKGKNPEADPGAFPSEGNTGLFNLDGIISGRKAEDMRRRLKSNAGNIWYGFITVREEAAYKINSRKKSVGMIKSVFPGFFRDMRLSADNVDLICALHLDRPRHIHIHYVFWEKRPVFISSKTGEKRYKATGRAGMNAMLRASERGNIYLAGDGYKKYRGKEEALEKLRNLSAGNFKPYGLKTIKNKLIGLAKELPRNFDFSFEDGLSEPYREEIHSVDRMLRGYFAGAKKEDRKFYEECGADKNPEKEGIKSKYEAEKGGLVLAAVKALQPAVFLKDFTNFKKEKESTKKRFASLSDRLTDETFGEFVKSYEEKSTALSREYTEKLIKCKTRFLPGNGKKEGGYKNR